jgi:hypothetical protein
MEESEALQNKENTMSLLSSSELVDQLFTESRTPVEFERKLRDAGFPFINSNATNEEWQEFKDKYPFDLGRGHLGGMPGYEMAWMVGYS